MTGGAIGSLFAQLLPPDRGRAQDAAGGRRGRGHDGHLRHAAGRRGAGGRAAAVRVATAQLRAGGAACRSPRSLRPSLLGSGAAVPVRRRAHDGGLDVALCVVAGVVCRRCSSASLTALVYAAEDSFQRAADALDVVAGDRRPGRRPRRPDRPQALGVGYDVIGADARRSTDARAVVMLLVVKAVDLGRRARVGNIRWRPRADAHDRWQDVGGAYSSSPGKIEPTSNSPSDCCATTA